MPCQNAATLVVAAAVNGAFSDGYIIRLSTMIEFLLDNIFLVLLACASAGGLSWTFARSSSLSLSPQAAVLTVGRGGGLFLDIRPSREFDDGHIARARNIPASDIERDKDIIAKYKKKPVVVICANGMKARATAQTLIKSGFDDVRVMTGGIGGWRDAQLPLVGKK